jgi:hypothetical protein
MKLDTTPGRFFLWLLGVWLLAMGSFGLGQWTCNKVYLERCQDFKIRCQQHINADLDPITKGNYKVAILAVESLCSP